VAGSPDALPATMSGHRCLARRVGSQHRALPAAHRAGTAGGCRAGGDRAPYSAPSLVRIGTGLGGFTAA